LTGNNPITAPGSVSHVDFGKAKTRSTKKLDKEGASWTTTTA
jgi:hypothetical protein